MAICTEQVCSLQMPFGLYAQYSLQNIYTSDLYDNLKIWVFTDHKKF